MPARRAWAKPGKGWVLPLWLLVAWDLAVRAHLLNPVFWASPEAVLVACGAALRDGTLWTDLEASLSRDFAGFALGAIPALALGLAMGRLRVVARLFSPSLATLRQVAIFAWVPLISVWFGSGEWGKVIFVAMVTAFPVLLNAERGAAGIEPGYQEVAQLYRLGPWQRLRRLILPGALPGIVTGLRLGLIYAWLGTIGAEYLLQSGAGIGNALIDGRDQFRMDEVVFDTLLIGLIGFGINGAAGVVERWIVRRCGG